MGAGDELLAAGQAERWYKDSGGDASYIVDRFGTPRWHEVWDGNPAIIRPVGTLVSGQHNVIVNGSGCRPYIRYPFTASTGWQGWTDFRAVDNRPVYYPTRTEQWEADRFRDKHGPYLMIEPSPRIKNPNRAWILDRWQQVIDWLPNVTFLQPWHADSKVFPGATPIRTTSFRDAVTILLGSGGLVSTEGGLAHAAAALKKPAVILFGGCVSAAVMSYPDHTNLVDDDPATPCGNWQPCAHCTAAWDRITAHGVRAAIALTFPHLA